MATSSYVAPDTKRVLVEYPDGSNRETTVKELRDFFGNKGESQNWVDTFFYELTTHFEARGKFAKYSIILD